MCVLEPFLAIELTFMVLGSLLRQQVLQKVTDPDGVCLKYLPNLADALTCVLGLPPQPLAFVVDLRD